MTQEGTTAPKGETVMRTHLFRLALSIGLGLSACVTLSRREPSTGLPDTSKACATWRWIGIRSTSATQCPLVPGWRVSSLFPKVSDQKRYVKEKQNEISRAEVIQELNRFCVYEIADPAKKLGDVPFPPAVSSDLVRFDQDCAAISPASGRDLSQARWTDVAEHFLSQVGSKPYAATRQLGVRLAFLDTQPDGMGAPIVAGSSWHGYTLAHIAQHLVCPKPGECAAEITTRLALRYVQFDAKRQALSRIGKQGGRIGMQGDLAASIESEVVSWQHQDPEKHLVLNLSVAWDPKLFGGLDEAQITEMRAGTQAVYRALQYAASFDVLVLAAAGNSTKCSQNGPLLPAAWESGASPEVTCGTAPNAPLVYAVGGVQSDGLPLANGRGGGMPRRAAYADNAVVECPEPTQRRLRQWLFKDPRVPTAVLTGSSVATAVVSSIAAVVWDSFPDLSPSEVMDILDASGDELKRLDSSPRLADFWFQTGTPPVLQAPTVHRLSLCTALQAACSKNPSEPCPLLPDSCEQWVPVPTTFPRWCERSLVSSTCDPWVHPQPGDPPCPGCPPG
jgi:subtilase family protein